MSKIVTYKCDRCGVVESLADLEAVQVYIFKNALNDPKYIDMEQLCEPCREQLETLLNSWISPSHEEQTTTI